MEFRKLNLPALGVVRSFPGVTKKAIEISTTWLAPVFLVFIFLVVNPSGARSYTVSGSVTVHFSAIATKDWGQSNQYSHTESTVDASFRFPGQSDSSKGKFDSVSNAANFRAIGNRQSKNSCAKPDSVQSWDTSGKLDAKPSRLEFDTYWHHGHGNDDVGGPFDYFSPIILSTHVYLDFGTPDDNIPIKSTNFDCNGKARSTTSPGSISFDGNSIAHRFDIVLSRTQLPETRNFNLNGSRDLTLEEVSEITSSLRSSRDEVAVSGHITWNLIVNGLPLPVPKFSALQLNRGEVLDLSFENLPGESEDPMVQWLIEPQPDCYKPLGFAIYDNDLQKALTNPSLYERQDNVGQPTIFKAIDHPKLAGGGYGSIKWNMLCSLSLQLQYIYGHDSLWLRSKPQIIKVVPRPWAIEVLNKPARTDAQHPFDPAKNDVIQPLEPAGAAPMLGINVRPDCIRNGRISSPVVGDQGNSTYCGIVFDGYWNRTGSDGTPPPSTRNFIQSAMMPWQGNFNPLPQTSANGYLAGPPANEALDVGHPQSAFQLIYWIVGHKIKQTNIGVMNPAWRKGGEWYTANHGATNPDLNKFVDCTMAHEALHGKFMKEALKKYPTSSDEVHMRDTVVDPAYLLEGMWDVEEEKLFDRIALLLSAAHSAMESTLSGEESSAQHTYIASNMPSSCKGTVEIVLPVFGKQRWDLTNGEIVH